MSTVNFSVPEEVKQAFNDAFKDQNKSAIIAGLMMEAVERDRRRKRSREAFDRILKRRKASPGVDDGRIRQARRKGRS